MMNIGDKVIYDPHVEHWTLQVGTVTHIFNNDYVEVTDHHGNRSGLFTGAILAVTPMVEENE